MPQLDFREALSTPGEKLFQLPPAAAVPPNEKTNVFARGPALSRAAWANIVFVAIASAGGLVCAFYFFNGAEVLRAAAAWPSELIYSRPPSSDKIDIGVQPNSVDQFRTSAGGSSDTNAASNTSDNNISPTGLAQPPAGIDTTNPAAVPSLGPVTPPIFSPLNPVVDELNTVSPGGGSLFQSVYQTAISITPERPIARTAGKTVGSTRRKVSSTRQKLAGQATTHATLAAKSTAQSLQQTQTANQVQMGMSAIHAPNQMMMGGGLGGVGGGGLGGIGGLGSVGGGLGGLGGLTGGHH